MGEIVPGVKCLLISVATIVLDAEFIPTLAESHIGLLFSNIPSFSNKSICVNISISYKGKKCILHLYNLFLDFIFFKGMIVCTSIGASTDIWSKYKAQYFITSKEEESPLRLKATFIAVQSPYIFIIIKQSKTYTIIIYHNSTYISTIDDELK